MRRSIRFVVGCSWVVAVGWIVAGWVGAAAAPPAGKVERVTVVKVDKKSVSGELVTADADGVILQPAGKADAVLIGWKEIATVSNGLTRAQAVAKWKVKFADKLCPTCQGERTVKHDACNGTGVDPATKQPCAACKGTGTAGKCTNPKDKEKKGKVDCPGPCLKLSVGTWKKHDDGKLWREFKFANGHGYSVSQGHVGEVWTFTKTGEPESKESCKVCGGTATVDCPTCDGKGDLACKTCRRTGVTGPACKDCALGQIKCATCKGSGLLVAAKG